MAGKPEDRFQPIRLLPGIDKPAGPPYLSGSGYYMASLFWETTINKPIELRVIHPVFSLYMDRPGLINARRTWVDMGDPTGYKWAIKYLGHWEHYERLKEAIWFRRALEVWETELEAKQLAEDLEVIRGLSRGDGKEKLTAAKYLANRDWEKGKRGRPTKASVEARLRQEVERSVEEDADYDRIKDRLKVVK